MCQNCVSLIGIKNSFPISGPATSNSNFEPSYAWKSAAECHDVDDFLYSAHSCTPLWLMFL